MRKNRQKGDTEMGENEFVAITTQEQFDNAIKERLSRESQKHQKAIDELKATHQKELEELKASLSTNEELEQLKKSNADLQLQINSFSDSKKANDLELFKVKSAYAKGLGEMVEFIHGTTEEEITTAIDKLHNLTMNQSRVVFTASKDDGKIEDDSRSGLTELVRSLK